MDRFPEATAEERPVFGSHTRGKPWLQLGLFPMKSVGKIAADFIRSLSRVSRKRLRIFSQATAKHTDSVFRTAVH